MAALFSWLAGSQGTLLLWVARLPLEAKLVWHLRQNHFDVVVSDFVFG